VVGILEWKHPEMFDPFPKKNRRDAQLVACFEEAGVPDSQIVYLRDRQATLARIEQGMDDLLSKASPGDLLVLYYCGHGYLLDSGEACFACYDAGDDDLPGWPVASIPETIERHFAGAGALLIADCCCAGSLEGAVADRGGALAYAVLGSSSATELSTGNWTFTEGLLAGLRGQAFVDGDANAVITLRELAEQIQGDMAFAEEQLATFATSGGFDPDLVLARARPRPHHAVGRRVEVRSGGEWYKARVIDADGEQLKVHYYGWEDSDDEWVEPAQIRDVTPQQYAVGSAVEVHWKGEWYAATVLELRGGVHYIQYDGYESTWNEWVASKRIRLPG
jgi:hypothetical protein